MKKKLPFYLFLVAIPLMSFIFLSYSSGAPFTGVTGSPGDGSVSCVSCHGSFGNYSASVAITTDIPTSGFELGKTYHITVTQTSTGAAKYGFEITAENTTNTKIGGFTVTDAVNTKIDGAGNFVTHTSAGTALQTWSFDWIAPTTFSSNITFYAAALSTNITGDIKSQTVLTNYNVGGVLAVNHAQLLDFSMYPNPSDGNVNFQLPSGVSQAKVDVFDYLGKKLMQKYMTTLDNTLNVSNLSTGIYFVRIQSDSKVGTKKLVVK